METDYAKRPASKLRFPGPAAPARSQRRQRPTPPRVRWVDRTARTLISLGGVGTIAAVLLVGFFLLWVVWPLFQPERLMLAARSPVSFDLDPLQAVVDERSTMLAVVFGDGRVEVYRADTGERLATEQLFERGSSGVRLAAWSFSPLQGTFAFAGDDGQLYLGRIGYATSFVPPEQVPQEVRLRLDGASSGAPGLRPASTRPALQESSPETCAVFRGGILQKTREGQYRLQQLQVEQQTPVRRKDRAPVVLLDQAESARGRVLAYLTADGRLHVARTVERKNLLTGRMTVQLREGSCPVTLPRGQLPKYLLLNGLGDTVFLMWSDGRLQRFDASQPRQPVLAETTDVVEEPSIRVTSVSFVAGRSSLAVGDSLGRVRVWFPAKGGSGDTADRAGLLCGHHLSFATGGSSLGRINAIASASSGVRRRCASALPSHDRAGVGIGFLAGFGQGRQGVGNLAARRPPVRFDGPAVVRLAH